MVLQVKKSPKKDGKWLSYRNFSIVKSEIYISKKFTPPKKDQFSILKFKFHNEKFMFELFKWYFQNQKTKEIKIMRKKSHFQFYLTKFLLKKVGRPFLDVWALMG